MVLFLLRLNSIRVYLLTCLFYLIYYADFTLPDLGPKLFLSPISVPLGHLLSIRKASCLHLDASTRLVIL